jgi:hypothetical protein
MNSLNATVEQAISRFDHADPAKIAPLLAAGLGITTTLLADIASSNLDTAAKYNMTHELAIKQREFDDALQQALGIQVLATVTNSAAAGDPSGQPTSQTVIPGQTFTVNLHIADQGSQNVTVTVAELASHAGDGWKFAWSASEPQSSGETAIKSGDAVDRFVTVTVPENAEFRKCGVDPTLLHTLDRRAVLLRH